MRTKIVYVLHKSGADSHYLALRHFLQEYNIRLVFREFGIVTKIFKSIVSFNIKLLLKQFVNIYFMTSLLFTKHKKVVLGIAPYDGKINMLKKILKGHQVYYHTSWACWDQTFQPKNNFSKRTLGEWKYFIENFAVHIFTVTNGSKDKIMENYDIPDNKISVVKHSLSTHFLNYEKRKRTRNSFIYLGRLVPEKGLEENLKFFKKNPKASLTVVGKGKLEHLVKKAAEQYPNIIFVPYLSNKTEMIELLRTKQFLILNSQKTQKWEELFGIVIIEAMSQGVIPISTKHTGPKEIIDSKNGYLVEEGEITNLLKDLINNGIYPLEKSANCIETSQRYSLDKISLNWKSILEV